MRLRNTSGRAVKLSKDVLLPPGGDVQLGELEGVPEHKVMQLVRMGLLTLERPPAPKKRKPSKKKKKSKKATETPDLG